MTDDEFRKKYGRDRPTERERRIAARIRVRADRRLHRETPQWIRDLAGDVA